MKKKSIGRKCQFCKNALSKIQIPESKLCCCQSTSLNKSSTNVATYRKTDSNNLINYRNSHNASVVLQRNNHNQFENISKFKEKTRDCKDILDQNAYLKNQNSKLRKHLENSSMKFNNIKITDFSTIVSSNETVLQEKLYQSNKNLQEIILRLNQKEKENRSLKEKMEETIVKFNQNKIQNESLKEEIQKCKSKLRKCIALLRNHQSYEKSQKLKTIIDQNETLQQKYFQLTKLNMEVSKRNVQLQQYIHEMITKDKSQIQSVCVKNIAKKVDNIQENITQIQQHSSEINEIKKQLQIYKKQNCQKFNVILSCEEYIENQLKLNFMNLEHKNEIHFTFFSQLKNVSNMFSNPEFKLIIQKLDMSRLLYNLINGIITTQKQYYQQIITQIQSKLNKCQTKSKGIQKKLINLSKLIHNNRIKCKTEKTRQKQISSKITFQNKENFNILNHSIPTLPYQDNSKTISVRKQFRKYNQDQIL